MQDFPGNSFNSGGEEQQGEGGNPPEETSQSSDDTGFTSDTTQGEAVETGCCGGNDPGPTDGDDSGTDCGQSDGTTGFTGDSTCDGDGSSSEADCEITGSSTDDGECCGEPETCITGEAETGFSGADTEESSESAEKTCSPVGSDVDDTSPGMHAAQIIGFILASCAVLYMPFTKSLENLKMQDNDTTGDQSFAAPEPEPVNDPTPFAAEPTFEEPAAEEAVTEEPAAEEPAAEEPAAEEPAAEEPAAEEPAAEEPAAEEPAAEEPAASDPAPDPAG